MTLDDLRAFGADVDAGLARCMGNEEFYLRLVGMAKADANFDALAAALAEDDLQAAFEAAHALKGVMGNLELAPLFDPLNEMTELLRARTPMDYSPLLAAVQDARTRLLAL